MVDVQMKSKRPRFGIRILSAHLLIGMLAWEGVVSPAHAQNASALRVIVLQGINARNNIQDALGIDPIVQVQDANGIPQVGAEVTFRLPPTGAGGAFQDGAK